jgi:hypothetical protein
MPLYVAGANVCELIKNETRKQLMAQSNTSNYVTQGVFGPITIYMSQRRGIKGFDKATVATRENNLSRH